MPSLTDVIHIIPPDKEDEVEDIFASAPGFIFTDGTRNIHGDPGSIIVYKSSRFGDIELRTADPEKEDERQLFSHYLWNASIKLAEFLSDEGQPDWSVNGQKVLELGSGVGLGGIVACLTGAKEVVISDYPSPVVLANLRSNVHRAIPAELQSVYRVEGHAWGELETDFATTYANHFDRIMAADCFWMPSQHTNLVDAMLHLLTKDSSGRIFAIAGFHTGRAKLASFFDIAADRGLKVEEIYEEDVEGVRRQWEKERDGGKEDTLERKRWLVIARLRRGVLASKNLK